MLDGLVVGLICCVSGIFVIAVSHIIQGVKVKKLNDNYKGKKEEELRSNLNKLRETRSKLFDIKDIEEKTKYYSYSDERIRYSDLEYNPTLSNIINYLTKL